MAQLNWHTVEGKLIAAVAVASGIEETIAQNILDELTAIGTPYDAAYTSQADADKAADAQSNANAEADWAADAGTAHSQATNALNYIESIYTDLTTTVYPAFDTTPTTLLTNRALIGGKLGIYAGKSQSTTNLYPTDTQIAGLPATLLRLRTEFYAAYDARPTPHYTGSYGSELLVSVPGRGLLTIQQTEVFLQPLIDEGNRILQIIDYP